MNPPKPDPKAPGQESVWEYPRPPRVELTGRHIRIVKDGLLIADSSRAYRVLETSHPPVYYLPREDIHMEHLAASSRPASFCEWKGSASYFHVLGAKDVAWTYPYPSAGFEVIRNHLAFYAAPMDEVTVDGERVTPQPGGFYGGWVTKDLAGPFKGVPGSMGW